MCLITKIIFIIIDSSFCRHWPHVLAPLPWFLAPAPPLRVPLPPCPSLSSRTGCSSRLPTAGLGPPPASSRLSRHHAVWFYFLNPRITHICSSESLSSLLSLLLFSSLKPLVLLLSLSMKKNVSSLVQSAEACGRDTGCLGKRAGCLNLCLSLSARLWCAPAGAPCWKSQGIVAGRPDLHVSPSPPPAPLSSDTLPSRAVMWQPRLPTQQVSGFCPGCRVVAFVQALPLPGRPSFPATAHRFGPHR